MSSGKFSARFEDLLSELRAAHVTQIMSGEYGIDVLNVVRPCCREAAALRRGAEGLNVRQKYIALAWGPRLCC